MNDLYEDEGEVEGENAGANLEALAAMKMMGHGQALLHELIGGSYVLSDWG